jgi:oxalate decarboxylase/phosphoglucose isomerase-like protein (cupin superfamily)
MFFYDLVDNAMRVPHWHSDGDEIGLVLDGKIRVTIWNGNDCEKQVFTAEKMGSWFIPKGTLHCLENVSPQKTQFLVCYDNPNTADRDFIDAWHAMPTEIICASTFLSFETSNSLNFSGNIDSKYKSDEYFNWENIDKPLRCISYYKVKNLL